MCIQCWPLTSSVLYSTCTLAWWACSLSFPYNRATVSDKAVLRRYILSLLPLEPVCIISPADKTAVFACRAQREIRQVCEVRRCLSEREKLTAAHSQFTDRLFKNIQIWKEKISVLCFFERCSGTKIGLKLNLKENISKTFRNPRGTKSKSRQYFLWLCLFVCLLANCPMNQLTDFNEMPRR